MREVFPGGIAGASLKRRWLDRIDPREAMPVFPGGIAGASLKRRPGGRGRDAALQFSPAESPGPH